MKTQQEIADRIAERRERDILGFETGELIPFLDYSHARPFLKEGVTEPEWAESQTTLTVESVRQQMVDYMEFAWSKANNFRGISASRSLQHYQAWLWLLGEEALASDLEDYEFYGKDELVKICIFLGVDSDKWDDGVRANEEPY